MWWLRVKKKKKSRKIFDKNFKDESKYLEIGTINLRDKFVVKETRSSRRNFSSWNFESYLIDVKA